MRATAIRWLLGLSLLSGGASGCGGEATPPVEAAEPLLTIEAPAGFPPQRLSPDNPYSLEKARLGRYLFYDRRLSGNETQSCGSCHQQSRAFSDGRATGLGSTREDHPRGPMSLANVGYFSALTWANPVQRELERQALVPLFGERPVELGLVGREAEMLDRLRRDRRYQQMFPRAFPSDADPFTVANVTRAIAMFERTLVSADSAFDRFSRGDATAMSQSAQRGNQLFFSERLECFHCHGGYAFTDSVVSANSAFDETAFHNTGLYNVDGRGAYRSQSTGVRDVTGRDEDMGRFRAPTLRNIAVTAPYMHDGSIATLDGVIDHYAAGGRTIAGGPNAGVGRDNPLKSGFITGFTLTEQERRDLIAFLEALTDERFLHDPRYADPFGNER
ncbi:MAG: di-heme enzyme [Deltaproteobacteria bacterium]|nr:di-heme enzyme [Deltaproteobacteria bacterium]